MGSPGLPNAGIHLGRLEPSTNNVFIVCFQSFFTESKIGTHLA